MVGIRPEWKFNNDFLLRRPEVSGAVVVGNWCGGSNGPIYIGTGLEIHLQRGPNINTKIKLQII